MGKRIIYVGISVLHSYSLLYEWLDLPIWLAVAVALVVSISTFRLVEASMLMLGGQLLLAASYLLLEPSVGYSFIVLAAVVFFVYGTKGERELKALRLITVETKAQQQQFNEVFQVVRKERHDYLKHIAALQFMLENDDMVEAKRYVATIVNSYEETNLSIKGERGAVAAVLHEASKKARAQGIALNYRFDVPCSQLPLTDQQLVSLIGNMLENAIHAASHWQQAYGTQAFVDMELMKRSGLFILQCTNSTLPLPNNIADGLFERAGLTTKDGHDGLGTTIIADIVKRGNGHLDFTYEKEMFTLKLKFPALTGLS